MKIKFYFFVLLFSVCLNSCAKKVNVADIVDGVGKAIEVVEKKEEPKRILVFSKTAGYRPVSYTHLTLPTILRV